MKMKLAIVIVSCVIGSSLAGPWKPSIEEPNTAETPEMEDMLLHTDNIADTEAEIESIGGRVKLLLGDDLVVAKVPRNFIAEKSSFASASAHISQWASQETLTFVQAYWMAREKKMQPPPPIQRWNEKTPPLGLPRESPFPHGKNSPYRSTMTGKIAFAALIPSGPGSLSISNTERAKIVSEVTSGLDALTNHAPASANLQFHIYYWHKTISEADSTSCPTKSSCHDVFANAILSAIGASTGQSGKDQVANYIKNLASADGAYIGFFSKYTQGHFAYAYFEGGPLYMQYSNDGWGSDQIDRVFAHETGHVFNSPDEYDRNICYCNTQYGKGSCTAKNSNCIACTSNQVSCLMDNNDLSSICQYSKKHFGWC